MRVETPALAVLAATGEVEAACAEMRAALEAADPAMPEALEGESDDQYTNRLTGADG